MTSRDFSEELIRPLAGLLVVEVSVGSSQLGSGMSAALVGMMLNDQGARRIRIVGTPPTALDASIEYQRVWRRGSETRQMPNAVAELYREICHADVVIVAGPRSDLEQLGFDEEGARSRNPRLIWCRIEPSSVLDPGASGDDYDLLAQAQAGVLDRLYEERQNPAFCDFPSGSYGAALTAMLGVTALLVRRERTGLGGGVATSLYDGAIALIGQILARAETPTPELLQAWRRASMPTMVYECADGAMLQIVPGAKGSFERLLELLDDKPTDSGFIKELHAGLLTQRDRRWQTAFREKSREDWLGILRAEGIPAEPVLEPAEALTDPHLLSTGHAHTQIDPDYGTIVAVGPASKIVQLGDLETESTATGKYEESAADPMAPPLEGVTVLDFGAYLAGPLSGKLLADLGAVVTTVEPTRGDTFRNIPHLHMFVQRGKRSLAMNLKTPASARVLPSLFAKSDIVMNNFRPNVADRIGVGFQDVILHNPTVVFCQYPAYGSTGPWADRGGFDQGIEAITGIQSAVAGNGMPPVSLPWSPVDIAGGWLGASSALIGYFARLRSGTPQLVESTLLTAGLYAKSGVFVGNGKRNVGPVVDGDSTGYGPGYRIAETKDGKWLAFVIATQGAWDRLLATMPELGLPGRFNPLRREGDANAIQLDQRVTEAFRRFPMSTLSSGLASAAIPHRLVLTGGREAVNSAFFDCVENRIRGRVSLASEQHLGIVEQPGLLFRLSYLRDLPARRTPLLGEHTMELMESCGVELAQVEGWQEARHIRVTTRAELDTASIRGRQT